MAALFGGHTSDRPAFRVLTHQRPTDPSTKSARHRPVARHRLGHYFLHSSLDLHSCASRGQTAKLQLSGGSLGSITYLILRRPRREPTRRRASISNSLRLETQTCFPRQQAPRIAAPTKMATPSLTASRSIATVLRPRNERTVRGQVKVFDVRRFLSSSHRGMALAAISSCYPSRRHSHAWLRYEVRGAMPARQGRHADRSGSPVYPSLPG